MQKETLKCNTCGKNWKRLPSRGRKPHYCPKCVKAAAKATQHQPKAVVQVQQIKARKVTAQPVKQIQASAQHASHDKNDISVGEVYQYYHPTDDKLKEETKGGSKWKCRCGYTIELKFSVSAKPTHKCTDNGKSVQMTRIDK